MRTDLAPRRIEDDLPYLEHLGFVLVDGDRPERAAGSRLLVALHRSPTLVHFDSERIEVWVGADGRGRHLVVDRARPLAAPGRFAWGAIWLTDRLDVANSFVTFGGEMEQVRVSDDLDVVRFRSPAPILRRAGHSQPIDPAAAEVSSFFARLMIPIDFQPGAEAMVTATSPLGLYAAMLADATSRRTGGAGWPAIDEARTRRLRARRTWLATHHPEAWREGIALLADLGLAGGLADQAGVPASLHAATRPAVAAAAMPGRTPAAGTEGSGS